MKEEHTAGGKQFLFVLLWAAILYLTCGVVMSAFGDFAFIGGIIAVIVFCIFGFFVLTHYTSKFTYSLKNERIRINRAIGKRNKEIEFAISDILRTSYAIKPSGFGGKYQNMRVSIFSSKTSMYIEYKDKSGNSAGVVIEPSEKFRKRIDRERKKAENG